MEIFSKIFNARKPAETYTHTHTCNFLIAIFLSVFSIFSVYSVPSFATNVDSGEDATCDEDTLESPTGPVRLRAEFTPEVINLKWYDENGNRVSVPTASNSCTYDTSISLPPNPTKTGYKFKGWKVVADYTPVEYLENDGTPYINTDVPTNNNDYKLVVDFMVLNFVFNSNVRSFPIIYGTNTISGNNAWAILLYAGQRILLYTNTHITYPRPSYEFSPSFQLNYRYLVDFNYNRAIVNGTQYDYDNTQLGTTNNGTITLLGNTNNTQAKVRIYSFKIYDNGTLIRDMIPAKDIGGVPCMYDKVTKQLFYNAGTGNFIAGPDL